MIRNPVQTLPITQEIQMISTGFHIPDAVLKKLATATAALQRESSHMTVAELRKAYRERPGATLGCYVRADFTKTGAVKSFDARPIDKSTEMFRLHGFETDVPILDHPGYAAHALAKDCAEFLLRREIDRRRDAGQRELVNLTDDDLLKVAEELLPLNSWLASKAVTCGSLSEQLRLRLVDDEIALRGGESNHQRLTAIAQNADYIAACQKRVETELEAAKEWRQEKEARPHYIFSVGRDFENRSEDDQTVIAYRDDMGWSP